MNAYFIKSALKANEFPESSIPEVCFIGRSNVGKSSVINALLGRRNLVKVGKTPGKTRLLNFFNVDEKLVFVDLPGYGYAKVSKSEKKEWSKNIYDYVAKREVLELSFLILDIRRIPSDEDLQMMEIFKHYRRNFIFILNKADKLSKNEQIKQLDIISEYLFVDKSSFIIFSAVKKVGIEDVWEKINKNLF